jgi:hypothetical protein
MKKAAPVLAFILTLAAAAGFMRLWWLQAGLERNYILDYARLTLGIPSLQRWPYRIEQVYHLSPVYVPQIFHNEPLYMVLLWPLIGTALVFICSVGLAATLSGSSPMAQGRVLRGPKLISNLSWKWSMLGKKKGFYIAQ